MTKTATYDTLLTVCIQDLHHGARALADAVPAIAAQANDPALAELLDRTATEAQAAAGVLAETGRHSGGDRNLWMAGIVDDARRDTRSIAPGPMLDVAMIGAIRKALAATIVSYETAIAVAAALDLPEVRRRLVRVRASAVATNTLLKRRLP